MRRNIAEDPLPQFECTIDGNTVKILSTGTSRLNVKLGADGLGLEEEVSVIWNGDVAYSGPSKTITLE